MTNSCRLCVNLRRETESWEMPHIWWWTCLYQESRANLKSFPYRRTKCKGFVAKPLDSPTSRGMLAP